MKIRRETLLQVFEILSTVESMPLDPAPEKVDQMRSAAWIAKMMLHIDVLPFAGVPIEPDEWTQS